MRCKSFVRFAASLLTVLLTAACLADQPEFIRYASVDGATRVESSDPGVTVDTPFAVASIGKLMTSVGVLRLVEKGSIDLDAPVAGLLPGTIAPFVPQADGITPRHLLTMTSGLPDYYDDDFLEAALANPEAWQTPQAAILSIAQAPMSFAPGTEFEYSNTNYVLLGIIVEHVSSQSYAEYMQIEVFAPAGMRSSFVFGSRALPSDFPSRETDEDVRDYYEGQGFGDGGVITTARDLATFYDALFGKRTLLTAQSLSELLKDPVGAGYGMGVVLQDDLIGHSGGDVGFSSNIIFDLNTGDFALTAIAKEDSDTSWVFDAFE